MRAAGASDPPRGQRGDHGSTAPVRDVAGLVVSFTTFTLVGAALLSALGLPEDLLRNIAIAALLVLAASLLSQRVAWALERPFLFLTRRRVGQDSNGFVVGLSVGLVFVPAQARCSRRSLPSQRVAR